SYEERSADFNARALARGERRDYLRKTYSGENAFYVNGAAVWTISPQRLSWSLEDVAREVRTDITAPDTPSSRTNANSVSTGPDFTLRLDPVNSAEIGARYIRFDIDGPGDNQSYSGRARWLHRVSVLTKLSLNYEATRVSYQDPGSFSDVFREDLFLGFETNLPSSGVAIDAGTTRILRQGADELNGKLARLRLSSQLTPESSLRASLAGEYSDTGSELLGGVTSASQTKVAVPSTPATVVAAGDVYYTKRGDIAYENRSRPFGFALSGFARRFDFKPLNPFSPDHDFDEGGGRISCAWLYSDGVRFGAYTEYLRRTFLDFPQEDTVRSTGATAGYNLTPNVSITLEAARLAQSSTVQANNFVDWRAMLSVAYTSGPIGR
ncbi:MAG: hypothetical protein WBO23_09275, partial [Burkholderiales bacterium]